MTKIRRAFTLIEVLMAISIGSFLMMGAAFFVYSVLQVWSQSTANPRIEEHLATLEKTIKEFIYKGNYLPPQNDKPKDPLEGLLGRTLTKPGLQGLRWKKPPGLGTNDDLLTLDIYISSPLFQWDKGPVPPITAYLSIDRNKNLCLLWHPKSAEESDVKIQRTLLSPYAKSFEYYYFDAKNNRLEKKNKPEIEETGELSIPDAIVLNLEIDEREEQIIFPTWENKSDDKNERLLY